MLALPLACRIVTTGNTTYRTDLTGSPLFRGAGFTEGGYDWPWTAGLGDTTLAIVPNGLPASDIAATRAAFVSFADRLLSLAGSQGYPAPTSTYLWGSNGTIANNAIVLARDSIGQLSALSPSVTFRTLNATTGASCRVAYTANSWNIGFTASVTLTNTSTAAWTGWTLRFNFANGQRITGNWDSVVQPSTDGTTITNASYNGNVAPGGSVVFGFQGTHNGTNTNPTAFTVNGVGCT